MLSRNLKNLTGDYPGIAAAIAHLKQADVGLDEKIVATDAAGEALVPSAPTPPYRENVKVGARFVA